MDLIYERRETFTTRLSIGYRQFANPYALDAYLHQMDADHDGLVAAEDYTCPLTIHAGPYLVGDKKTPSNLQYVLECFYYKNMCDTYHAADTAPIMNIRDVLSLARMGMHLSVDLFSENRLRGKNFRKRALDVYSAPAPSDAAPNLSMRFLLQKQNAADIQGDAAQAMREKPHFVILSTMTPQTSERKSKDEGRLHYHHRNKLLSVTAQVS